MILAAAACADGKTAPPPELVLAWQCQTWGTLPEPGGIRDQRIGELERMTACLNAYDAMRKRALSKNWVELAKSDPHTMKIVNYVMELRRAVKGDNAKGR